MRQAVTPADLCVKKRCRAYTPDLQQIPNPSGRLKRIFYFRILKSGLIFPALTKWLEEQGIRSCHLSMSDEEDTVMAFVIAEK